MRKTTHPNTRAAFTLVELLVVLIIIAVLMTIGLVIGARARAGARTNATIQTISLLDNALTAFVSEKGELPKPLVNLAPAANFTQVIVDDLGPPQNGNEYNQSELRGSSCAWFVYQASKSDEAKKVLEQINPKFIVTDSTFTDAPGFRVINDAFGFPIRYVHPTLHGVYTARLVADTFGPAPTGTTYRPTSLDRRSTTGTPLNSDGGQCTGNRPYFYSVGDDGKPDTREDNIYAENGKPSFIDGP